LSKSKSRIKERNHKLSSSKMKLRKMFIIWLVSLPQRQFLQIKNRSSVRKLRLL